MHVYVRMVISYTMPAFPGVPCGAVFEFIDEAPTFPASSRIREAYEGLLDLDVQIRHTNLPAPIYQVPTHEGSGLIH